MVGRPDLSSRDATLVEDLKRDRAGDVNRRSRRNIEGALASFVGRLPSISRRADAVLDACLQ